MENPLPSSLLGALALLFVLPSLLWLVGLLRWLLGGKRSKSAGQTDVRSLGVAIVGRNEEAMIRQCLTSVLAQQEANLTNVLFTDDHSADSTLAIAERIASEDRRLTTQAALDTPPNLSPKKHALSTSFHKIDTDGLAVTDADCVVPPFWLASLHTQLDSNCGAVIGASWPIESAGLGARVYRWERLIANVSMASACGWGFPASACGHSILFRRSALLKVDAPVRRDLPSGDDDLTVQAIARAGYRIEFCRDPRSVVREAGARGSRTAQVGRHQSVTHLYPLRWRVLYASSTVTGIATLPIVFTFPLGVLPVLIIGATVTKIALDFLSGAVIARKLRLDTSTLDIFAGSVLLPLWMIWRVFAFVFGRKFSWRGRDFTDATHATIAASGR